MSACESAAWETAAGAGSGPGPGAGAGIGPGPPAPELSPPPNPDRRYSERVTSPEPPSSVRPVDYKGEPLDSERGPGLGCFRFQVGLLVALLVFTPLTVAWNWSPVISIVLLFLTLILLLFAGQTVIFLLRLVAADKRDGRRVPLAAQTPTVGELEEADLAAEADANAPEPGDPGVRE